MLRLISDAEDAAATSCAITKMHGDVIQIAQVPGHPSIILPEGTISSNTIKAT